MNRTYLSIGSNLENRASYIKEAIQALQDDHRINVERVSSIYETAAVGLEDQPDFLNVVVQLCTSYEAIELLEVCQSIEQRLGRKRTIRWGPRTVDLDILLFNQESIQSERLVIPHPRLTERRFVLVPLLELSPQLVYPETNRSIASYYEDARGDVWKYEEELK